MRRSLPAAILCLLLRAFAARAHDADMIHARVAREPGGALEERVTLTMGTLALLVPLPAAGAALTQRELDERLATIEAGVWDAMPLAGASGPCARLRTGVTLREGYVELSGHFTCPPGDLTQTFRLLSLLPAGYRVVLGLDGQSTGQRFAEGSAQTLVLPAPESSGERAAGPTGLGGWLALGVHHIFTGYDHLAFLLALLVVGGGWRRVLWLVTSFTLAHSLTLGATALGILVLDPLHQQWVEVAIASSIIYVAAENLLGRGRAHRAWVTFGFGLIHGFGFASVLSSYGMGDAVVTALLGFNLGVEAGQACVVAALFPLVRLLQRRRALGTWTTRLTSVAVLAAGGFWLIDRALG